MRLICPNCSAQYEVDGSLIPDEGRDVQCSNCGHNWFELPPAVEAAAPPPELEVEDDRPIQPAEEHPSEDLSDADTDRTIDPEPEVTDEPVDIEGDAHAFESEDAQPEEPEPEPKPYKPEEDTDWDWPKTRLLDFEETAKTAVEAPEPVAAPKAERGRRPADVAALEILKEEADRELAKRKLPPEPEPIESQPDLVPADDPRDRDSPSRALRARMARLRGEEEDDAEAEAKAKEAEDDAAYREPRKDLLPDIDEINSSLRPAGLARSERSEEEEAEHRRGFRVGFVGIVAAVVLAIIAYAQAPAIASVLPGTETALISYVDWANAVRDGLNALFGS